MGNFECSHWQLLLEMQGMVRMAASIDEIVAEEIVIDEIVTESVACISLIKS